MHKRCPAIVFSAVAVFSHLFFNFGIASAQTTTGLNLVATSPAHLGCSAGNQVISAIFDSPLDAKSVTPSSFTLTAPNGNRVEGKVEYQTLSDIARDVYPGATGDDVVRIQQFLIDAGFLKLDKPNGLYGEQTQLAMKAFQAKLRVPMTGNLGPKTRSSSHLVLFKPSSVLASNTKFIAAVTADLRTLQGQSLGKNIGWSFTTGPNCLPAKPTDTKPYVEIVGQINKDTPALKRIREIEAKAPAIDVRFNLTKPGGAPCTSELTMVTAAFSHHIPKQYLTQHYLQVLGPDDEPVEGKLVYLHLHDVVEGIKQGSTGKDVSTLQAFLIDLGMLDLKEPNGKFGAETKKALINWQKSVGLPATGVYDAKTILNAHVAVFQPTFPMEENAVYTFTASADIKDINGVPLGKTFVRRFITGPECGQGLVGTRGPRGFQGLKGDVGPQGPPGERGERGSSGGGSGGAGGAPRATVLDEYSFLPFPTTESKLTTADLPAINMSSAANRVLLQGHVWLFQRQTGQVDIFNVYRGSRCGENLIGQLQWPLPQFADLGAYTLTDPFVSAAFFDTPNTSGPVNYSLCGYTTGAANAADIIIQTTITATEVAPD